MKPGQQIKMERYNYFHIPAQSGAATFRICSQRCYLKRILLNKIVIGAVVRVIDNQTDVSNTHPDCIAEVTTNTLSYPGQEVLFEVFMEKGLTISTSGTTIDYTVVWALEALE